MSDESKSKPSDSPEKDVGVHRAVRLYAWQPKGHGEYSFFVAAASETLARDAINNYIQAHIGKSDGHYLTDYGISGWGTDYYELSVIDVGEVITNAND